MNKIFSEKTKAVMITFFPEEIESVNVSIYKINSFSQIKQAIEKTFNNQRSFNKNIYTINNSRNIKMTFPYFLKNINNVLNIREYSFFFEEAIFYFDINIFQNILRLSRHIDIYISVSSLKDIEKFITKYSIDQINFILNESIFKKKEDNFLLKYFNYQFTKELKKYNWVSFNSFNKPYIISLKL